MKLLGGKTYSCPESCSIPRHVHFADLYTLLVKVVLLSNQEHTVHSCGMRLCPASCDLCKRLCIHPHLHGITPGERHLCGSVLTLTFFSRISRLINGGPTVKRILVQ